MQLNEKCANVFKEYNNATAKDFVNVKKKLALYL